ncbi:DUF881 domain-containing protein [uncultured Bifidobacterium sp.]|uniref:DUF881 domain-containing protein n=1 Tax=uncultured Bifidobacterium sp. TaxID=165187 RepID=UPI0026073308|nr:DUF881 domain-containing protein [uncultured Bifidobacterium sp.]
MGTSTKGRHGSRRSLPGAIAVFIVLALTGYLLVTNFRVNRTATVTSDTGEMIAQRVQKVSALRKEVDALSVEINTLNTYTSSGSSSSTSEDAGSGTMLPAVKGPGITVTLDDSPLWETMVGDSGSSATINDYVVHQQDVEAVVNALWKGGAEAMMIQDQRVLFNSAVICKGNVLMLQGKQYSPPYTISAIGPADDMVKALNASESVQIYKQYVAAFGLGWKVTNSDQLKFPQSSVLLQALQYASVETSDTSGTTAKSSKEDSGE